MRRNKQELKLYINISKGPSFIFASFPPSLPFSFSFFLSLSLSLFDVILHYYLQKLINLLQKRERARAMVFSSLPAYLDPTNWQQVRVFFNLFRWFLCQKRENSKDKYSCYFSYIFLNIPDIRFIKFIFCSLSFSFFWFYSNKIIQQGLVAQQVPIFFHLHHHRRHPHNPIWVAAARARSGLDPWPIEPGWPTYRCQRLH